MSLSLPQHSAQVAQLRVLPVCTGQTTPGRVLAEKIVPELNITEVIEIPKHMQADYEAPWEAFRKSENLFNRLLL
jgi:hypothetical protein